MKFRVDPWSVEYGASVESDLTPSTVDVNPDVELPADQWTGRSGRTPMRGTRDGAVRRRRASSRRPGVDRVPRWRRATRDLRVVRRGVARCGAGLRAEVIHPSVGRGVFSASAHAAEIVTAHGTYAAHVAGGPNPEALWLALQERMARREVEAAEAARRECPDPDDALVVVDGPLTGRQHVAGAIGVIKTHGVAYLPPELHRLVSRLGAGARTPLFTIGGRWSRHSWYLRLPGGADAPWAGVVRVECSTEVSVPDACALADTVGVTLGRYASEPYKDPRAPQNLYPIGGLERELRRRLGDPGLLFRALRVAAHGTAG